MAVVRVPSTKLVVETREGKARVYSAPDATGLSFDVVVENPYGPGEPDEEAVATLVCRALEKEFGSMHTLHCGEPLRAYYEIVSGKHPFMAFDFAFGKITVYDFRKGVKEVLDPEKHKIPASLLKNIMARIGFETYCAKHIKPVASIGDKKISYAVMYPLYEGSEYWRVTVFLVGKDGRAWKLGTKVSQPYMILWIDKDSGECLVVTPYIARNGELDDVIMERLLTPEGYKKASAVPGGLKKVLELLCPYAGTRGVRTLCMFASIPDAVFEEENDVLALNIGGSAWLVKDSDVYGLLGGDVAFEEPGEDAYELLSGVLGMLGVKLDIPRDRVRIAVIEKIGRRLVDVAKLILVPLPRTGLTLIVPYESKLVEIEKWVRRNESAS